MSTRGVSIFAICITAAMVPCFGDGDSLAAEPDEIRRSVHEILGQIHPVDTREWWLSLGPKTPPTLIEMYGETRNVYHQTRLLRGLSWFEEDPRALDFLKRQAAGTTNTVVRNEALGAIGAVYGVREGQFISEFLANDESRTRFAAAEALERIVENTPDPALIQRLKSYEINEKQAWILRKLEKSRRARNRAPSGKVVATLKQNLHEQFAGVWSGFAVLPEKTKGPKLVSKSAEIQWKWEGSNVLAGVFSIGSIEYEIKKTDGLGTRLAGVFVPKGSTKTPKVAEFSFDAEMRQFSDGWVLRLECPGMNSVFVARRKP